MGSCFWIWPLKYYQPREKNMNIFLCLFVLPYIYSRDKVGDGRITCTLLYTYVFKKMKKLTVQKTNHYCLTAHSFSFSVAEV